MNVMNRKLFRSRLARDKLNKMGGIMASSQPLMQTVQKFANGSGPLGVMAPNRLSTASVQIPRVDAEDMNARNFQREADRYRYDILKDRRRGFLSAQEKDQLEAFKSRFGIDEPEGFPAKVDRFLSDLIPVTPRPASEIQMFGTGVDAEDVNIAAKKQSDDKAVSDQIASEYLSELTLPESQFMMPGVTPSPDKKEEPATTPKAAAARLTDGAARDKGAAGPVAQDQVFMNAAKSGELGAEKQVQAIINEGTPQEVEKSLEQLMAEFTSSAPEYEGMDKGLAIAKIGFAMAAGQSPNAISNIATALSQGADMFIQDKSKRDAFNRQVQLSALQYGLGEQGKDRAARRQMQYKTTDYVLMPGETYTYPDGREITGGEDGTTISLNQSDILKNGLPDGVQGTTLANSIIQRRMAYDKAAAKAIEDAKKAITVTDPKKITQFVTDYSAAADSAIQANNAIHLTKQVMVMNADGQITGFRPGFNSALAKAMALAGVDATSYTDRDLAIADLRKVFQKLVPLTLGKDQSANSISDKDVDRLANAYMSAGILDGGIMALVTTPSNVLNSKLSGVLTEFESAQERSLATLTSLEQTGQEFITPSGTTLGSRVESQRGMVQDVFPQKGDRLRLAVRDDGTFFLPD